MYLKWVEYFYYLKHEILTHQNKKKQLIQHWGVGALNEKSTINSSSIPAASYAR